MHGRAPTCVLAATQSLRCRLPPGACAVEKETDLPTPVSARAILVALATTLRRLADRAAIAAATPPVGHAIAKRGADIYILADARTEADNIKLLGGNNPAAAIYTKNEFIQKYPVTTQRPVNAFYKTLK